MSRRITVPDSWDVLDFNQPEVSLVMGEESRDSQFAANLVVTAAPLNGQSFKDWQDPADDWLAATLADYVLIDLERVLIAGHEGGRRLAAYASADGESLTMEQWFTAIDDMGYVLTMTVDTWRYDEYADEFELTAASWQPTLDSDR